VEPMTEYVNHLYRTTMHKEDYINLTEDGISVGGVLVLVLHNLTHE
jgi:hypothetical protein